MLLKFLRANPAPQMTTDTYYRRAIVPTLEQNQAGVSLGLGTVSGLTAMARLQNVVVNGHNDTRLVMTKGEG